MKRALFSIAGLLLAACAQQTPPETAPNGPPELDGVMLPLADQAGNRMEALSQNGARWCTEDGVWCVDSAGVMANFMPGTPTIALPSTGDIWPVIVRIGETALVGVIATDSQAYAGGGGSASHLTLYEIANGAAREVLRMPFSGSANIRACFDEEDSQQRAGACQDLYEFTTRISMDELTTNGAPVLKLQTAAASFPGPLTRGADSLQAPALTEADLIWAQDETCSYSRTYTRGADGLYAPDQPLPGCNDYLEP